MRRVVLGRCVLRFDRFILAPWLDSGRILRRTGSQTLSGLTGSPIDLGQSNLVGAERIDDPPNEPKVRPKPYDPAFRRWAVIYSGESGCAPPQCRSVARGYQALSWCQAHGGTAGYPLAANEFAWPPC